MHDSSVNLNEPAVTILAKIVTDRRRRMLEALEATEQGLEFQVPSITIEDHGDSYNFSWRSRSLPMLSRHTVRSWLTIQLDMTFPNEDELSATETIIDLIGQNFVMPWLQVPAEDDDPSSVVLFQSLFWPLSEDFIIRSLSEENVEELAHSVASKALSSLITGVGRITERCALNGLVVPEIVTWENISLRPLTSDELREVAGEPIVQLGIVSPGLVRPQGNRGVLGSTVLECHDDWDIKDFPPPLFLIERTTLAMQLLGVNVGGPGWISASIEPCLEFGPEGRTFSLPSFIGGRKTVDASWLSSVVTILKKIPREAVTQPVTRQDVALNRFMKGKATEGAESLLEFTIGMEAVLLPEKFEGELSFRLRTNAAWLLGEKHDDRREIARVVGKIYAIRSNLVHGLKPAKVEDVHRAADWAETILRRLLVLCLNKGWPSNDRLTSLALG